MKCFTGAWYANLDNEDRAAFDRELARMSRADLYGFICAAHGGKPFSLTTLKDHVNGRCICD